MSNELQPLSGIFVKRIFRIPDYQRGYAWLQPQLVDFWEDLVNLQPNRNHYTGLLSLRPLKDKESKDWRKEQWVVQKGYKPCHIVDGQQRLTTFVILLHEIIKFVRGLNQGKSDSEIMLGDDTVKDIVSKYICIKKGTITTYLFGYENDNPSAEYMTYKVLEAPLSKEVTETYYTKNLKKAKEFFANNISNLYEEAGSNGFETINALYKKLTNHLMFNLHEIDDNYDVFVAFETMNNRGKKLTNLELLKNRLIYLTTLYDDHELDNYEKFDLREDINDAWKEVYTQLGKNKEIPLSDDDFLRAHWINYFKYSRKQGNAYISFLLKNFSSKSIFEKTSVPFDSEEQSVISDDIYELEDSDSNDVDAEPEVERTESKLKPEDIKKYVKDLMNMAKYWYDSYFPYENINLTKDEKKAIDKLNRIGIGYFRPLVTAILIRRDVSPESRVKIFDAIERFIFVVFRLGRFNASYGSSDYYRASRLVYKGEMQVDELCKQINDRTTDNMDLAIQNFVARIDKFFTSGDGFYNWKSLPYFFCEYEAKLAGKNKIDRFDAKSLFTNNDRDKISIEHILPQTPTKDYWKHMFRQFNENEIKMLSGALGNLLPLSQCINSALQNDSFDDKKHSKDNGRRGYENGCHSEIEVSKHNYWDAFAIYERTENLLKFMQERWNIEFNEEQLNKLIGISFVNDGREIPEELEAEIRDLDSVEENNSSGLESKKLQFWSAFVNYATEKNRASDIARQKASDSAHYHVHIGANGYHLLFSIPNGNTIKMSINAYNVDVYNRLLELKEPIEAEFGESLNWDNSNIATDKKTRAIYIEEKADDFNLSEQPRIFDWIIDHFDKIILALSLAGERLSVGCNTSESRFEIRKRYWTYALDKIHEAHGNPGSFCNVNPSRDNWINGFFGIGGFFLCCIANQDSARAEVVFARTDKEENKNAFDALSQYKTEIEEKLGTKLQWNRGANTKSSKVFVQLDHVSIENEEDWPKMAKFHAEWTKKFYDVIVPYIKI